MRVGHQSCRITAALYQLFIFILCAVWLVSPVAADVPKQPDWQNAKLVSKNDYVSPGVIASAQPGHAVSAWTQYDGGSQEYGVWVSRYRKEGGWSKPLRINNYAGQADEPAVAVNHHGDAIVVWIQYSIFDFTNPTPLTTSIWYSKNHGDDDGWSEPQQLAGGDVFPIFPKVAIDEEGNAIVVWQQTNMDLDISNIYAKRYSHESGWSDASLIQADASISANSPEIAMNAEGEAAVVWDQIHINDNFYFDIGVNRYDVHNGWVGAQGVPDSEGGNLAKAAVDEHGDVMVVFSRYDMSIYNDVLYASRYTPDQDWGAAQLLQELDSGISISSFDLAGNRDGEAFVIWKQNNYGYFGDSVNSIRVNHFQPDTGWEGQQMIGTESTSWQWQMNPSIGVDDHGNAVAAWEQENPDAATDPYAPIPTNVLAFRYSPDSGWDAGQGIQKTTDTALNVQLSVNGPGDVFAIWIEQDNVTGATGLWANQID